MPDPGSESRDWLSHQVAKYRDVLPVYDTFASTLGRVLEIAAHREAGPSIIQTRPKAISSFAEKALRKRHKYADPVNQFTDLCGARVITRIGPEVEAMGRYLEEHFEIDRENSVDASQRLRPTEFGYRSVHYIVSFREGVDYGVEIPPELLRHPISPLESEDTARRLEGHAPKAEIQVRTLLEHAYADFVHDLSYKGAFAVPDSWLRELAGTAASLERIGHTFDGIAHRLGEYAASYGAWLPAAELAREIETLQTILEHDPENAKLVARLGKLLITAGEWEQAIERLAGFVQLEAPESAPQPILRDLGIALCKRHRDRPESADYRRGQAYLELAADPAHADVDAVASLAGTWKRIDEARVRELYRRAFEIDPADPYALENYLESELERDPAVLAHMRPQIHSAMERCRQHLAVGINLPWALFSLGKLHLLLGDPYPALDAYAKGVAASSAAFMIEAALGSLDRLEAAGVHLEGLEWARRLLLLGLAARFPSQDAIGRVRRLVSPDAAPIAAPVVIVVGGATPLEEQLGGWRDLVLQGFAGFEGTVISGGTIQGIPGVVGELTAAYPDRVRSIGYIPRYIPADATLDERYTQLRHTDGHGFTPHEPLQNWIDIIDSGILPRDVRVVGINGGRIAAIEYRIALALGARVGVLADSGREVGRLVTDARWSAAPTLLRLPAEPDTLRAFLAAPGGLLSEKLTDSLARRIHEAYREARRAEPLESDLAMRGWDELPDSLKDSNRQQALDIEHKLRAIGYTVERADGGPVEPVPLSDDEVETLARMEHGRWTVERLSSGWTPGEYKDVERRVSPHLVTWAELPESVRAYDRAAVRKIPELLAEVGLAVREAEREPAGAPEPRPAREPARS